MAYQYIYTMKKLSKVYPPNAQVLKNIWLSFFPPRWYLARLRGSRV